MFGKLGLAETSSSRTTPLYGMASENKRVGPAKPVELASGPGGVSKSCSPQGMRALEVKGKV
jgi:hypothetical protein